MGITDCLLILFSQLLSLRLSISYSAAGRQSPKHINKRLKNQDCIANNLKVLRLED